MSEVPIMILFTPDRQGVTVPEDDASVIAGYIGDRIAAGESIGQGDWNLVSGNFHFHFFESLDGLDTDAKKIDRLKVRVANLVVAGSC